MKFAILFLLLSTAALRAEDVNAETAKAATGAEANRAAQRNLETPQKAKKSPDETTITYSGFLVDLAHAEKKSRILSLRQPVDPKKDYKNFYVDERNPRPKGFILFALSF
jgi:hypothetical protein